MNATAPLLWIQTITAVIALVMGPLLYLFFRMYRRDLSHLEHQLDDMFVCLHRIERELRNHIQWHLGPRDRP